MSAEANVLSNFFPAESYLIDNIITSTPHFATLERAPWDQLLYSQDETLIRISAIDAALSSILYRSYQQY